MEAADMQVLADAYAFLGNSLLKPMSQTETVGLDPAFWQAFPDFGDASVAEALAACDAFATEAEAQAAAGNDMVQEVSVEYTKLFIGPPSPAAPPWETMNREEGVTVGFGQPTFEMQEILSAMGLQVSNENNQYADHLGIELLALAEIYRRAAEAVQVQPNDKAPAEEVTTYIEEHPAGWVGAFRSKVRECAPQGYYDNLLGVVEALLAVR